MEKEEEWFDFEVICNQENFHQQVTNYYENADCSGGKPCEQLCVSKGCKSYAIVCSDEECTCHQVHLNPQLCVLMPPEKILDKLQKKQVDSPELTDCVLSFFEKLIDWLSDERDRIEAKIKDSRMTDKEREFLKISKEQKFEKLTGEAISEVLSDININLAENYVQNLQKELEDQWSKIIDPVKEQIQSLETVLYRVSEELKGKFSDNTIIAEKNNIIDEDLKDYIARNKIKNPTSINMKNNHFEQATIENASLRTLNVSGNKIKEVSVSIKNMFAINHSQLTKLELFDNYISDITELASADLPCLLDLNLNRNKIAKLPELTQMPELQQAWFRGNKLRDDINEFSKSKISQLEQLGVSDNRIQSLEWLVELLHTTKELKWLYLSNNEIEELPNLNVLQDHQVKLTITIGIERGIGGNPISKYTSFLETNQAAFNNIAKISNLSLTAKNEEEFEMKKKTFRSISVNFDNIYWCKQ